MFGRAWGCVSIIVFTFWHKLGKSLVYGYFQFNFSTWSYRLGDLKMSFKYSGSVQIFVPSDAESMWSYPSPLNVLGAGKGGGKRKKGAVPRPPPLLLVQDAEAALTKLQERVSALLLRSRAPSPPTPTRCPSSLPGWSGDAPLWQKSALLNQGSTCESDFYTPALREFITPWESVRETKDMFIYQLLRPDCSIQLFVLAAADCKVNLSCSVTTKIG